MASPEDLTYEQRDTLEEAQEAAKDFNFKYKAPFCPLINKQCNTMCLCHTDSQIEPVRDSRDHLAIEKPPKYYKVHEPYCANAMFCESEGCRL